MAQTLQQIAGIALTIGIFLWMIGFLREESGCKSTLEFIGYLLFSALTVSAFIGSVWALHFFAVLYQLD